MCAAVDRCNLMAVMRRLLVLLLLVLTNHVTLKAQPMVDGVIPFFDSSTGCSLLSIDKSLWGKNYTAYISSNENIEQTVTIDGAMVDETLYTFCNVDADSRFCISTRSQGEVMTQELSFTFLPIMHIEGDFGYDYCNATVTFQNPGEIPVVMSALIKWRGGTTNAAGKNKRNYKIKLIDDKGEKKEYRFFGLRKDNVWILDAGQVDLSRVRNRAAADLWNDFAHKPYYMNKEPEALSASRGEFVELFVNNRYHGVFNMCEPIDRKQMKLMKFNSQDGTIHGGLWKSTGWGYATFWDKPGEYDNTSEKWNVFEVKYPEVDDLCPTDYSTLYNAIDFVSTSTDEEFVSCVDEYFDIPVLIDYYIFCNILNAFDICGKNIYWAVYDKTTSKKLTPAMWDLDCTVGQNYTNNPLRPDYVRPDMSVLYPTRIISRLVELDANGFNTQVAERYSSLRSGLFSTDSLIDRYANLIQMLMDSGAASREEQRWSYDSDISGLTLNLQDEFEYIAEWISARCGYLDDSWSCTSCIVEQYVDAFPAFVVNVYGQPVDDDYKGVVIMNGRKVMHR